MNILVVGNGFDLAHGLPTKYSDFLDYLTLYIMKYEVSRRRCLEQTWGDNAAYWKDYTPTLEKIYDKITKNPKVENLFNETSEHFKTLIAKNSLNKFYENTFVRYCLYVYSYKKTFDREFNWIDIENELLSFLTELHGRDFDMDSLPGLYIQLPQRELNKFTRIKFYIPTANNALISKNIPPEFFRKAVFEHLFNELEGFSLLLKFYLSLVQEKFQRSTKKFFQINSKDSDDGYHSIFIDGIVSFNYTDTARMYAPEAKIHFINGSLANKKIILGVENPNPPEKKSDEYYDRKIYLSFSKEITPFFKNVQRVLYDFSYDYRKLYKQIVSSMIKLDGKNQTTIENHVYIIGHSLALSDKYILTDLMMNSDTTTIYYHDETDKYGKISNLYQLLGDELFSQLTNNPVGKPYISLINQDELTIK